MVIIMELRIGFIGSGKVGCSLAAYFEQCNLTVSGVYSRSDNDAKFGNINELINVSDIVFITVTDTALSAVWSGLDKTMLSGKIICHCSGSISSAVFENADEYGAHVASVHPMLAFDSKKVSFEKIRKAFFTIEGDAKATEVVSSLLDFCGNKHCLIDKSAKAKYHAAAVFASNFVVATAHTAVKLLTECGFDEKNALEALTPMLMGNMDNICQKGTCEALTGPIERNDLTTVEKHLLCLDEDTAKLYKELSKVLVSIAEDKHKDRNYEELYRKIGG
jgi:predicted short-subunit dehydrogenase-like oxidoreductase (DUF2520 family)